MLNLMLVLKKITCIYVYLLVSFCPKLPFVVPFQIKRFVYRERSSIDVGHPVDVR